jgi:RNA polymerase sigma-32 factor
LVVQWRGIVVKIARRYYKDIPEDVIQEGYLGLCIAAGRFDPSQGFKFATYAQYWVKALILDHMIRNHGPVRFGTTKQERHVFFNLGKNRRVLDESSEVLAARMQVDERIMEWMRLRLSQRDLSFDHVTEDNRPLELPSGDESAEAVIAGREVAAEVRKRVHAAVKRLEGREREIIEARFLRAQPQTLQEIGDRLGVSRERVRQLEERAKKHLARMLMGKEKEVA